MATQALQHISEMTLSGQLLFRITQAMRRSRSLQILREVRSAPTASPKEIEANQLSRLSALLTSAENHVPYYREMFRRLGCRSSDIRTLKDFASIPILTKDIIRERLNDLIREDIPKEKLIAGNSGGSTGVPLRFYRDRSVLDAADAGTFRNLLQAGWKPGDMIAYFWGWNSQLEEMPSYEFELRQYLRRSYQFDPFQSGPEEMDGWLDKFEALKPKVVFGYASTVARFAAHAESRKRRLPPVAGAFTTAEKLYSQQRETISRVFGCRVYDCYGSSEVINIASECSHGRMHVNTDFAVLEVDRAGIESGEPAPFIVTGLWNHTMPFIRYRNEDCGELLDGTCDCSNHFPEMQMRISRVSDNFTLPGGKVVHGEFFTHLMYGSEGISMFQFHQTAVDSITLWIVPGPGDPNAREKAIRKAIQEVEKLDAAGRIRVQLKEAEAIPLSATGKHRFIRSDVSAASAVT
jgi:phenylacetate-coenzyme A ligase PaaK-like adenylate-forming protein